MKRMKAIRSTLPLAIAGYSCSQAAPSKTHPPAPTSCRIPRAAKFPGAWSGSHRSGAVVPNWIRTFNDPELSALVEDAIARNPDLQAAAANVEASRYAVKVAASSLYPRIGLKLMGERQGREIHGDLDKGVEPPDLGGLGVESSGGSADTRSVDKSSQRWVYGLGVGAAWEADIWGRIRSKKAAAQVGERRARSRLRIRPPTLMAAAVARAYFSADRSHAARRPMPRKR